MPSTAMSFPRVAMKSVSEGSVTEEGEGRKVRDGVSFENLTSLVRMQDRRRTAGRRMTCLALPRQPLRTNQGVRKLLIRQQIVPSLAEVSFVNLSQTRFHSYLRSQRNQHNLSA